MKLIHVLLITFESAFRRARAVEIDNIDRLIHHSQHQMYILKLSLRTPILGFGVNIKSSEVSGSHTEFTLGTDS